MANPTPFQVALPNRRWARPIESTAGGNEAMNEGLHWVNFLQKVCPWLRCSLLSNFTDFGITNHFLKTQVHLMKAIFVARSAGSSLFCLPEPCLRRQTGHTELQSLLPSSLVEVTGESGADVLLQHVWLDVATTSVYVIYQWSVIRYLGLVHFISWRILSHY